MKKIGLISLIALLLLQTGGVMLYYQFRKAQVYDEMQKVVKEREANFKSFVLSLADFEKSRVGKKELSVGGKMYDIKSVRPDGNKLVVLAIEDREENEINGKIKKMATGRSQSDKVPQVLVQLLTMDYILPAQPLICSYSEVQTILFKPADYRILSRSSEIFIPPPQSV